MTVLTDAVVLVLGASGGLGSRIAAMLDDEGAIVVRAARRPESLSGPDAYLADLRTEQGAASLVAAALQAHGRLDGVVVAAGVVAFGPAAEVSDATLAELLEVNLVGPIRVLRDAADALAASADAGREPFVVTISGVVSESPTAGMAAYSASKAGLAAFVSATAREYRRRGIRVLDARPGHTDTGLATRAVAGSAPAFGTALDPDDVAARIVRAVVDGEKDLPSSAFTPES
ncbi:SDR family NAD(P)-dependent oxidoreductase [Frigoribacterium faeni]|uniref:3-hydroxyacyl-CoA dehydrogenase n=1 Tax=Frigoribacterium faeni TaxID=145483 RepID=A0A7W3JIL3_9MICO|nr:SDR family oxidoreductase [Frigoribacterium faeni]MBA8813513.1 cyclic-di-GMP-binding biofilm dispersal mediator protein [Frigoribacterium faeni]GEK82769.1 3-hydroxyacyl-CoA dehydrogenase [Frigoribacterium faeni]